MADHRMETTQRILSATDHGRLSREEMVARLQTLMETEVSRTDNEPIDTELIQQCERLIWRLQMQTQPENSNEQLQASMDRFYRKLAVQEKKQKLIRRSSIVAFSTLVLFFAISSALLFGGIKWTSGQSNAGGDEYLLSLHEIKPQQIAKAVQDWGGEGNRMFHDKEDLFSFLGFRIGFPDRLGNEYAAAEYQIAGSQGTIQCACIYKTADGERNVVAQVSMFEDWNNRQLIYEQDHEGEQIRVNGVSVYTSTNMGMCHYIWQASNCICLVFFEEGTENGLMMVQELVQSM